MSKGLSLSEAFDPVSSREERRTTGRIVAVVAAFLIIFIAAYHAWIRNKFVLAGVISPVLIMVLYTAWVLYSAKREKHRRACLIEAQKANEVALVEVIATQPREKPINLRPKRLSIANVHDNENYYQPPMNEKKRERSRSKNPHSKKAKRKAVTPTNTTRVKTTRPPLKRSITIE